MKRKYKWFDEDLLFTTNDENWDNMKINKEEIAKELKKILKKEKVKFNEDWGVGSIYIEKGKYIVEKWYYRQVSYPVKTKDIMEVVKWLLEFSEINEPMDYNRALAGL